MRHIGILKPDTFISILNYVGIPIAIVYFLSMFVAPLLMEHDWEYIQNTWDRWQGLNVGMLAFVSSIAAFNISRHRANKQRERDFLAEKAFLPATLSELCHYFEISASIMAQAWTLKRGQEIREDMPVLGSNYREVFRQCIRYANPEVGDYLSKILVKLQVHDSRLKMILGEIDNDRRISPDNVNMLYYLYRLGELQALVNKLFDYARSLKKFDSKKLEWEDFGNAFGNLNLYVEDYFINDDLNLQAITERMIAGNADQND